MIGFDWSCPSCAARVGEQCHTRKGTPRPRHGRRLLVTVTSVLVHLWAPQLPFADRLRLATSLTWPHGATAEGQHHAPDTHEETPEWDTIADLLNAGSDLVEALTRAPEWHQSGVQFEHITTQLRELRETIRQARRVCAQVARTDDLAVSAPIPQGTLHNYLARWRATQLDTALHHRTHPTASDAPRWHIDYRENGAFRAAADHPSAETTTTAVLHGVASTPHAAVDVLRHWHTGTGPLPQVTVGPQYLTIAPALVEQTVAAFDEIDSAAEPIATALTEGGAAYDATEHACDTIRTQLRRTGTQQLLTEQAAALNAASPQLPRDVLLPSAALPGSGSYASLHGTIWVPSSLIISTLNHPWGEFGDHRPEMLTMIADGLASDVPLDQFLHTFFHQGPIDLHHIPGWAGPLYQIGSNGNHRVHAARILGIPWLLATVSTHGLPLDYDLTTLVDQDCAPHQHPNRRAYTNRHTLLTGLLRRGIIHGELTDDTDHPARSPETPLHRPTRPVADPQPHHRHPHQPRIRILLPRSTRPTRHPPRHRHRPHPMGPLAPAMTTARTPRTSPVPLGHRNVTGSFWAPRP